MLWTFRGNICEVYLYFGVYIAYLFYGLLVLLNARERILDVAQFEFAAGWSWLRRPRDDSNDELENFSQFLQWNWHWYLAHLIVSSLVRQIWPHRQHIANAAVCCLALVASLRVLSVAIISSLLLTYYVVALSNSKSLIWMLSALWMTVMNLIKSSDYFHNTLGYSEYFTLIILLSWSLLRCCSYGLNRIIDEAAGTAEMAKVYSLEHFLGYTLYYPCLVYGPFLGFQRYAVVLHPPSSVDCLKRFCQFLWEMTRVAFWWIVLQIAQHYLYVHYMARDVVAVQVVETTFGLHAIGYFMGQFFFLYYVITYGLGIAFARYDGLNPPHRPRCIGRIHFYSDMWKYFDEGLYEFLFRHIYCELCNKGSGLFTKLFATAATFTFVFVWHGCYSYVLIWSVLNFGCLVAEKCFKALISSPDYKTFMKTTLKLSDGGLQRVNALLATQLFIPAAFSNVYFISGQEVGDYLMRGAYLNGIWNYLALTLCSYCFFQCSEVFLHKAQDL